MDNQVPEYYKYLKWYDLDTPLGLYDFVEEMKQDGIKLEDYLEIKVYYDILLKNAFRDEPNMTTTNYVVWKLKRALIRYGFAHTTRKVENRIYYYWNEKGE